MSAAIEVRELLERQAERFCLVHFGAIERKEVLAVALQSAAIEIVRLRRELQAAIEDQIGVDL